MASSNIALNWAPESFDFDLGDNWMNDDPWAGEGFKPEQSQGFDELGVKLYSGHRSGFQQVSER